MNSLLSNQESAQDLKRSTLRDNITLLVQGDVEPFELKIKESIQIIANLTIVTTNIQNFQNVDSKTDKIIVICRKSNQAQCHLQTLRALSSQCCNGLLIFYIEPEECVRSEFIHDAHVLEVTLSLKTNTKDTDQVIQSALNNFIVRPLDLALSNKNDASLSLTSDSLSERNLSITNNGINLTSGGLEKLKNKLDSSQKLSSSELEYLFHFFNHEETPTELRLDAGHAIMEAISQNLFEETIPESAVSLLKGNLNNKDRRLAELSEGLLNYLNRYYQLKISPVCTSFDNRNMGIKDLIVTREIVLTEVMQFRQKTDTLEASLRQNQEGFLKKEDMTETNVATCFQKTEIQDSDDHLPWGKLEIIKSQSLAILAKDKTVLTKKDLEFIMEKLNDEYRHADEYNTFSYTSKQESVSYLTKAIYYAAENDLDLNSDKLLDLITRNHGLDDIRIRMTSAIALCHLQKEMNKLGPVQETLVKILKGEYHNVILNFKKNVNFQNTARNLIFGPMKITIATYTLDIQFIRNIQYYHVNIKASACCALHRASRNGLDLTDSTIESLAKSLSYVEDEIDFFFGKEKSHPPLYPGKTLFSLTPTRLGLYNLNNLATSGKDLLEGDFKYLIEKLPDRWPNAAWTLYHAAALNGQRIPEEAVIFLEKFLQDSDQDLSLASAYALCYTKKAGYKIPEKAFDLIQKELSVNDEIDLFDFSKRHRAIFAFAQALRNYNSLPEQYLLVLNQQFSDRRKDAAYALAYYFERPGKKICESTIAKLEKLISDRNPSVSKAATIAIKNIITNNPNVKLTLNSLEKALLHPDKCVEAALGFLNAAKQGRPLSVKAMVNLGTVLSGEFELKAKHYASLAFSYAAKNKQPVLPETLRAIETAFAGEDTEISNNLACFFGYYASFGVKSIVNILGLLIIKALNLPTSINASFAIKNINKSLLEPAKAPGETLRSMLMSLAKIINEFSIYSLEAQRNSGLALAYGAKNNYPFDASTMDLLGEALKNNEDHQVKTFILSAANYCTRNDNVKKFTPYLLIAIVRCLDHCNEEFSQNAALVLESYIENRPSLDSVVIKELKKILANKDAAWLGVGILKKLKEKTGILPHDILKSLINILNMDLELDTQVTVASMLEDISTVDLWPESIMSLLGEVLNFEGEELVTNHLVSALKNSMAKYQSRREEFPLLKKTNQVSKTCEKLKDVLNDESKNLKIRQDSCWILAFSAEQGVIISDSMITILTSQLDNVDAQIRKASAYALRYFIEKHKNVNELTTILKNLEEVLDTQEMDENIIYALSYASEHGYQLSGATLKVFGCILLEWEDKSLREYVFKILKYIRHKKKPEMSTIVNSIYDLEEKGRTLLELFNRANPQNGNTQLLNIIEHFVNSVKNSQFLTLSNFDTFHCLLGLIKDSNLRRSIIVVLGFAARNGQVLPLPVMAVLGDLLKDSCEVESITKTILLAAKNGQFLSTDIIASLEEALKLKAECLNNDILFLLKLAVGRNMLISNDTLLMLSSHLTTQNFSQEVSFILATAAQNQVLPKGMVTQLVKVLANKDLIFLRNISKILRIMINSYSISLDSLKLIGIFDRFNDPELCENIIHILEAISKNQKVEKNLQDALDMKRAEFTLIHSQSINERCAAIKILEENYQSLSTKSFAGLARSLMDPESKLRESATAALKKLVSFITIPDEILEILGEIVQDLSNYHTMSIRNNSTDVFWELVHNQMKEIPPTPLWFLCQALFDNRDHNLYNKLLEIIIMVKKKHLSEEFQLKIAELIKLELAYLTLKSTTATALERDKELEYLKTVSQNRVALSFNCLEILIHTLNTSNGEALEILQNIVFNRQQIWKSLFSPFCEELSKKLVSQHQETAETVESMFIYMIQNNDLNGEDLNKFISLLDQNLSKGIYSNSSINILKFLIDRQLVYLGDNFLFTQHTLSALENIFVSETKTPDLQCNIAQICCFFAKEGQLSLSDLKFLEEALNCVTFQTQAIILRTMSYVLKDSIPDSVQTLISTIFSNLAGEVMNTSDIIKKLSGLNLLQVLNTISTLIVCESIDLKALTLQPSHIWIRTLLVNEILSADPDLNSECLERFYLNLENLEKNNGYGDYDERRDTILELLRDKQARFKLSISQINELLVIFKVGHAHSINILTSFCSQSSIDDIKIQWVKHSIKRSLIANKSNEREIAGIASRIIRDDCLGRDVNMIEIFCERIQNVYTHGDITRFLDLIITHKVDENKLHSIMTKSLDRRCNTAKLWAFCIEADVIELKLHRLLGMNNPNISILHDKLYRLLESNWGLDLLIHLIDSIQNHLNSDEAVKGLIQSLENLYNFKLPPSAETLHSIFMKVSPREWSRAAHEIAISTHFELGKSEKNSEALICELDKCNNANSSITLLVKDQRILNILHAISVADSLKPVHFASGLISRCINKMTGEDIKKWAKEAKLKLKNLLLTDKILGEILSVIKRACYLQDKYEPRVSQIMAVIIMLFPQANKGRLAQISTGEGKSTTISIFAVVKALQGETVDVITSSPILAKRDAQAKSQFYRMFNLEALDNSDDHYNNKGLKKCYAEDYNVVYGDAGQFQFDILRQEYILLGTRGNRKFGVVIIDEVDSMLIDDSSKIAMLASAMPGIDHLQPLLLDIWEQLNRIDQRFFFVNGKLHWTEHAFEVINGKVEFRSSSKDETPQILEISNPHQFTVDKLNLFARKITEDENLCVLPKHLKEFVKLQIPKWVESAIAAKRLYHKDESYIIVKDNKGLSHITPVDYENTGVVQKSTNWGDGLHQFLQIKHGLKMTPESLITNFLSNVEFFSRYGSKIFGLTGTLGFNANKKVLGEIYPVDFVIIPQFKQKQFLEFPGKIVESDLKWRAEIVHSTLAEINKRRGVLVICESIKKARDIYEDLRKEYMGNIRLYSRNDSEQQSAVDNFLEAGEVIVATNLAGRGTDIKTTPEIKRNGGLHVCLTFMPSSLRVEEQAFGRTSRQGQGGTAEIIINKFDLKKVLPQTWDINTINELRECREKREKSRLEMFMNKELEHIRIKDSLFKSFCTLLKELKTYDNRVLELLPHSRLIGLTSHDQGLQDIPLLTPFTKRFITQNYQQHKRNAVEERWALWLAGMSKQISMVHLPEDYGLKCYVGSQEEVSLYHAVSHQLQYQGLAGQGLTFYTPEELESIILTHILSCAHLYCDNLEDLKTFLIACGKDELVEEDIRMMAVSRMLNLSIITFKADGTQPTVLKRLRSRGVIFIYLETSGHYRSLLPDNEFAVSRDIVKLIVSQKNDKIEVQSPYSLSTKSTTYQSILYLISKKKVSKKSRIERKFAEFRSLIFHEYQNDAVIKNPNYFLAHGNELIKYESSLKNKAFQVLSYSTSILITAMATQAPALLLLNPDKNFVSAFRNTASIYHFAQKAFQNAIELDPIFAYNGYYNKAYAIIKESYALSKESNKKKEEELLNVDTMKLIDSKEKPFEYKIQAKRELSTCMNYIENYILPQISRTQLSISSQDQNEYNELAHYSTDLKDQFIDKINILQMQLKSISQAVKLIEKSQKLVDITAKQEKEAKSYMNNDTKSAIIVCEKFNQFDQKKITIDAHFHDLNVTRDMGRKIQNQPDDTLDKAPANSTIDIIFMNCDKKMASDLLPISLLEPKRQEPTKEILELSKPKDMFDLIGNVAKETIQNAKDYAVSMRDDIATVKRDCEKLLYNLNEAKAIPVCITVQNMDIVESLEFFGFVFKLLGPDTDKASVSIKVNASAFKEIIGNMKIKCLHSFIIKTSLNELIKTPVTEVDAEKVNDDTINAIEFNVLLKHARNVINEVASARTTKKPNQLDEHKEAPRGIDITLTKLDQEAAARLIDRTERNVHLRFNGLNKSQAKQIIYLNEKDISNAIVKVNSLDPKDAKRLILLASREQEGFNINLKSIEKVFLNDQKSRQEIQDFKANGMIGLFDINEKGPIPWCSITTVGTLGVMQMVSGAAIAVFSSGGAANLGIAIMSEGINDIIMAVKSGLSQNFSWKDYAVQKTISLTVTIATAGLSSLKEAANLGKTALNNLSTNIVRSLSTNATEVGAKQIFSELTKEGMQLTGKLILVSLGETGARTALNYAVDTLSEHALSKLELEISRHVGQEMKSKFDHKWGRILTRLGAMDKLLGTEEYQNKMESIAKMSMLSNEYLQAAESIIMGILGNNKKFGNAITLLNMALVIPKLALLIESFDGKFSEQLEKLQSESKLYLHYERRDISKEDSIEIDRMLKKQGVLDDNGVLTNEFETQQSKNGPHKERPVIKKKIDLGKYQNLEEKIMAICKKFSFLMKQNYEFQRNLICKQATNLLVSEIMATIQGQLIKPISSLAVNSLVDHTSKALQRACSKYHRTVKEQIQDFQDQRLLIKVEEGNLENIPNEAYQEYEEMLKEHINTLETDGEGNLLHLNALSKIIGRPIEVYVNGKRYFAAGKEINGKPLQLAYTKPTANTKGHWDNLKSDAKQTGNNNCLFDAIASQTGGEAMQLRKDCAQEIRNRSSEYVKLMPVMQRLSNHSDPIKGKSLLVTGGAPRSQEGPQTLDKHQQMTYNCTECLGAPKPQNHPFPELNPHTDELENFFKYITEHNLGVLDNMMGVGVIQNPSNKIFSIAGSTRFYKNNNALAKLRAFLDDWDRHYAGGSVLFDPEIATTWDKHRENHKLVNLWGQPITSTDSNWRKFCAASGLIYTFAQDSESQRVLNGNSVSFGMREEGRFSKSPLTDRYPPYHAAESCGNCKNNTLGCLLHRK